MKLILTIGIGSFAGGILRYYFSQLIQTKVLTTFPLGTFFVNFVGCLLIGIVFGISERGILNQEWRLFLATGLLGGFTTFSAFSSETIAMLRDGQFWFASVYIILSIFVCLAATLLGIILTKYF